MLIAFFVNDIEREHLNYTTTLLAQRATMRGHRICYVTPSDFVLSNDDSLRGPGPSPLSPCPTGPPSIQTIAPYWNTPPKTPPPNKPSSPNDSSSGTQRRLGHIGAPASCSKACAICSLATITWHSSASSSSGSCAVAT